MVTAQPMTAEPQRTQGRIRPGPALQQRGRQARGDDRLRRRPGDAGPRLPGRGAGPVRHPAGHPGDARVRDHDGTPTVAHFTFVDRSGHIHPPQAKRIAPDLFFQRQIYRGDGGMVLLPPGRIRVTYGRGPEYRLKQPGPDRPRSRRGDARRPARALDRPGGPRLLRRRPPHPRGRLRPLHRPDARRVPEGHVPAGQGRGPERRLHPDLGPVLRLPAPILRAAAGRPERAVDRDQVRRRGQRVRFAGAGARLPAQPPRPDLSRLRWDRDQGLADMDDAGAALGQVAGGGHGLRPFRLGPGDRSQGRHRTPAGGPRPRLRRLAHARRGRPGPAARRFRGGRRGSRRRADPRRTGSGARTGRRHACRTSRSPR